MMEKKEHLLAIFEKLLSIRNECSCEILSSCGLPDITVRQIEYLKVIDEHGEVTFSGLAKITRNSKPTITEMVNRFVQMECVYREKSPDDGRMFYIRLTEKGQMIARSDESALLRLIERMTDSLDEREMNALVRILRKVE